MKTALGVEDDEDGNSNSTESAAIRRLLVILGVTVSVLRLEVFIQVIVREMNSVQFNFI